MSITLKSITQQWNLNYDTFEFHMTGSASAGTRQCLISIPVFDQTNTQVDCIVVVLSGTDFNAYQNSTTPVSDQSIVQAALVSAGYTNIDLSSMPTNLTNPVPPTP